MKKILTLSLAALCVFSLYSCTPVPANTPSQAVSAAENGWTISGPIGKEGTHGWPFGSYVGDLSKIGYVEEEYFIEGSAQSYQAVNELENDGNWTIAPDSTANYKTRILVQRPADPSRFNGTVVVEWANVSAGYEISCLNSQGVFESGFAYAAVSAQPVGIHSNKEGDRAGLGLIDWDARRYKTLSIPGEGLCYDIFTQCARALGPDRPKDGVDPMGGLEVKKLIAAGESQSGSRVAAYINGVQPIEQVFDGFIPIVFGGAASDFLNEVAHSGSASGGARTIFTRLRDDPDCKVLAINSQTEAIYYSHVRQPDTDSFRSWEIAGSVHGGDFISKRINQLTDRDGYSNSLLTYQSAHEINDVSWLYAYEGALVQMQNWINGSGEPPRMPPIEVAADGSGYIYDDLGNVKGGLRLPEITVPAARYIIGPDYGLGGCRILLSPEALKSLYTTHNDYVAKMTAAANSAAEEGIILPYRAKQLIRQAEAADIPEQLIPETAGDTLR